MLHYKVIQYTYYDEEDYRSFLKMKLETYEDDTKIKTEVLFSFMDGEPEDATISRDFSGVLSIYSTLDQFYKFGQSGIPVEFAIVDCADSDTYFDY